MPTTRLIPTLLAVPMAALLMVACTAHGPDDTASATLAVEDWTLPAPRGSAQPDLVEAPDGDLLLAWIQRLGEGRHALEMARFSVDGWSAPTRIAAGGGWFVNWADTPHLTQLPDGSLWAHWLQRSGEGPYDYGIALVRSGDGGGNWQPMPSVHPSGRPLDFGFVSLWAADDDRLGIAWLDSRHKQGNGGHGHHGTDDHDGLAASMALFATTVSADGRVAEGVELDDSTCDCCQTSVARSTDATLLAYRARRSGEIRDIEVVRAHNGAWSAPVSVHTDNWRIPGCPVNGPAIAAVGERAWVLWYTEADEQPVLRLGRSDDAGRSFNAPLEWRRGQTQLGRVALAADADAVWWAWMEEASGQQSLWVARGNHALDPDSIRSLRVASIRATGRASGFPRLALREGWAHLAWTDVHDGQPVLAGARVHVP